MGVRFAGKFVLVMILPLAVFSINAASYPGYWREKCSQSEEAPCLGVAEYTFVVASERYFYSHLRKSNSEFFRSKGQEIVESDQDLTLSEMALNLIPSAVLQLAAPHLSFSAAFILGLILDTVFVFVWGGVGMISLLAIEESLRAL